MRATRLAHLLILFDFIILVMFTKKYQYTIYNGSNNAYTNQACCIYSSVLNTEMSVGCYTFISVTIM
jgi:hypothetical protein